MSRKFCGKADGQLLVKQHALGRESFTSKVE
jgi:hypothetical protein